MAIPQDKYINITSTNVGDATTTDRELGGLVFTLSKGWTGTTPMSADSLVVCHSVDQVKKYFSSTSDEVQFAERYFSYQSPSGSVPASLSFARVKVTNSSGDLLKWAITTPATATTVSDVTLTGVPGTVLTVSESSPVQARDTSGYVYDLDTTVTIGESAKTQVNCAFSGTASMAISTSATFTIGSGSEVKTFKLKEAITLDSEGKGAGVVECTAIGANVVPASSTWTSSVSGVTVTNAEAGWSTATGNFTCVTKGLINCAANALNTIITGISGWTEVNNPTAGTTGHDDVYSWYTSGGTLVSTPTIQEPKDALTNVNSGTNNFGSFTFIDAEEFSCKQIKEVAVQNQTYNYKYLYVIATNSSASAVAGDAIKLNSATTVSLNNYLRDSATDGINGTCIVHGYDKLSAEMPMAIFSATNYDKLNGTTYQMFKQFTNEMATVSDLDTAETYDGMKINYYGKVQINGTEKSFYQRGVNFDGENTAVYCNEIWLKSKIATDIMDLLLSVEKIPANEDGELMLYSIITSAAESAITNGTIEKNKTLTTAQKTKISNLTGDSEAWFTVQQAGYICSVEIKQVESEYKACYKLVYSKGDAISYVEGTDILI